MRNLLLVCAYARAWEEGNSCFFTILNTTLSAAQFALRELVSWCFEVFLKNDTSLFIKRRVVLWEMSCCFMRNDVSFFQKSGRFSSIARTFFTPIATIDDMLKNVAQIVHTCHRGVSNFIVNLLAGIAHMLSTTQNPPSKWNLRWREKQRWSSSHFSKTYLHRIMHLPPTLSRKNCCEL